MGSKLKIEYGQESGGLTELWSNDSSSLAAGDITVPNLDNYDTVIFLIEAEGGTNYLRYAGISLSELATSKNIGIEYSSGTYLYLMYRTISHSAANTLSVSAGYYMRNGATGNNVTSAVIKKIYGVNMS